MIKEGDASRPGWRDFERVIGEVLCGKTPEGKQVFDVFLEDPSRKSVDIGLSIKSKELSRLNAIRDLDGDGRVYMELANSPAKFWAELARLGIEESDFGRDLSNAQAIGENILQTVHRWHEDARDKHSVPGFSLDLSKSVYVTVSYSKPRSGLAREYQIHSFSLDFPAEIRWEYRQTGRGPIRSIRGFDPRKTDQVLFDWYPLSGGQLKYYPLASTALYKTGRFSLLTPQSESILAKAMRYWPDSIREHSTGYIVQHSTKDSTGSA